MKPFIDLGTRNKGTFWEYVSAYSFLHTKLPVTEYEIPIFLGVGKGELNKHCHHIDIINKTKELLINEFKEGKYTEEFFRLLDDVYRKPLEEIKEICKMDIPDEELVKYLKIIVKNMAETHKPMLLALKSQFLEDFFKQELLKVEKDNVSEFTSLLLTPTKFTLAQLEEEKIIEILRMYDNEEYDEFFEKADEKLKELVEKCGWFHMEYTGEPWKASDYLKRLNEDIKESPKQRLESIKELQKEFFETHYNSDFLKQLVFVMQEFLIVLDFSKADVVEGIYNARALLSEIAKRLGISSWIDVRYLMPDEIKKLLINGSKADKSIIKERRNNWAVLLDNNELIFYPGKEAVKLADKIMQRESPESLKEFKGMTAYPGKVKGIVKIVTCTEDMGKFEQGDILVTHATTTALTSVIKKSAAIISDQDGLLSHTAIVAREFKIPCIVQTRIGTEALKDGDLVEVDANDRIVRKIC